MESADPMFFQGEECNRDEGARDWLTACGHRAVMPRENEPSNSAFQLSLQNVPLDL